jgi:hypothetical protein
MNRVIGCATLVGAAFAVVTTSATSLVPLSFDKICASAQSVFRGTVRSIESRRDGDSGLIHTFTTFTVNEWIVGGDGRTETTLRMLGGRVEDEGLRVDGMPSFDVGKRYIIFTREGGRHVCPIVGWSQGCFRVVQPGDGESDSIRTYDHHPVLAVTSTRVVTTSASNRAKTKPLSPSEFVARIRTLASRATVPTAGGRSR